jgi:hypothetical protein
MTAHLSMATAIAILRWLSPEEEEEEGVIIATIDNNMATICHCLCYR